MDPAKKRAIAIIVIIYLISAITGALLSKKMALFGLWLMPALYHLYPIATVSIIIIFSVVTSRKVLWGLLILLLGAGLLLECLMFWLTNLLVFRSPIIMSLFILFLLVFLYGVTWVIYFFIAVQLPPSK